MARFKPIAQHGVDFTRRWEFPVDEEVEEWLRQYDEEYPKMDDMGKLAWHTRYFQWLDAQSDD